MFQMSRLPTAIAMRTTANLRYIVHVDK